MQNKNIGFLRAGVFGDTIIALHGIYATKVLYPESQLIVYTNRYGVSLYSGFDFIDKIIDISNFDDKLLIENINQYEFEIFILTNPNRKYCKPLAKTNCKRIFSFLSAINIFNLKFKTLFYPRKFSYETHYKRILKLVRKSNPKKYDNCKFDFSKIAIQPQQKQIDIIDEFLNKNNISTNRQTIVVINPFVHSVAYNISINGWKKLAKQLAQAYKNFAFIIPTYSMNPQFSIDTTCDNIFTFYNDDDLLNIAALLKKTSLVLSPSTGTSHLANNLKIPIIWFCNHYDSKRWRGDNMNENFFIMLEKSLAQMDIKEEEKLILKAINLFKIFFDNKDAYYK